MYRNKQCIYICIYIGIGTSEDLRHGTVGGGTAGTQRPVS